MKSSVNINAVLSTPDFKVISVSGAQGDTLEKHKVNENALLLVKEGSVIYKEGEQEILLHAGSGQSIPADVYHKVTCQEQAEVFVVIPLHAKMKFEK